MGIPRKGGQCLVVIYLNQLGKSDGISGFQCGNQRLATMVRRAFEVESRMQISLNAVWLVIVERDKSCAGVMWYHQFYETEILLR